jgi:beta-glucanase (GH16 family)
MGMKKLKLIRILFVAVMFTACNTKKTKDISDNKKVSIEKETDWVLVWSDEFNTENLNKNNWNFQVVEAGRFNEEWQRYTNSDKNAYIENDCLVIEAIHESEEHGENQYTSARLNTAGKQSWKYGKFSARIKLPEGEGIWPAFWMLGANINENGGDTPWPKCGEIDILELYGSKDDAAIEVNAHYADSTDAHAYMGAETYTLEQGKFSDDFHIFELEWTEKELIWFVDGNEVTSMPIDKPYLTEFHKEFFILLNIAVGGTYAGRPNESTKFPQKMTIDWIRVHQKI